MMNQKSKIMTYFSTFFLTMMILPVSMGQQVPNSTTARPIAPQNLTTAGNNQTTTAFAVTVASNTTKVNVTTTQKPEASTVSQQPILPIKNGQNKRIVIVGAGLSGLSAANRLKECGFRNVSVVESTGRVGGRIRPVDYGNGVLEMGAELLITGEESDSDKKLLDPLTSLAKQLGAIAPDDHSEMVNGRYEKFYTICGGQQMNQRRILDFVEWANKEFRQKVTTGAYMSVGQIYDGLMSEYSSRNNDIPEYEIRAFVELVRRSLETATGSKNWTDLSPQAWLQWMPRMTSWPKFLGPKGYKPILDHLVSKIAGDGGQATSITFNKTVKLISYKNDSAMVTLTLNDRTTLNSDHVIVTSSIGHLKTYAEYGRMFWPTNLPQNKLTTISNIGYGSIDKIFLIYRTPFWPKDLGRMYFSRANNQSCQNGQGSTTADESELEKIFWYFHTHPHMDNVLVTSVAGTNSQWGDVTRLETARANDVMKAATNVLRRFTNDPNVPEPVDVKFSKWSYEESFKGAYSYMSTGCSRENQACDVKNLAEPLEISWNGTKNIPIILLAGEHTVDGLIGTTHAAYVSGLQQAERLCAFYRA